MKTLILILFCSTMLGQIDKDGSVKHFYAGASITFISGSIINHYTDRPTLSTLGGITIGCLAGLGKEFIYDKQMGKGVFSKNDYLMTGWGALCGGVVVRCWIDWKEVGFKPRKKRNKYVLD